MKPPRRHYGAKQPGQLDWIEQGRERQQQAAERLQHITDARRESFAIQDFAKRRRAMLRHTRPALDQGEA